MNKTLEGFRSRVLGGVLIEGAGRKLENLLKMAGASPESYELTQVFNLLKKRQRNL